MICGFRGDGKDVEASLDGILLPADLDSIFARPVNARVPFRGRPPAEGIDGRILAALARRDVSDAIVLPIVMRDRVVNLLYADNGGEALGETSVAALEALCGCVARAYERLILERKGAFT